MRPRGKSGSWKQFVETVKVHGRVPEGMAIPRPSVILPSAEGYVGRHHALARFGVPTRDPELAKRMLDLAAAERIGG